MWDVEKIYVRYFKYTHNKTCLVLNFRLLIQILCIFFLSYTFMFDLNALELQLSLLFRDDSEPHWKIIRTYFFILQFLNKTTQQMKIIRLSHNNNFQNNPVNYSLDLSTLIGRSFRNRSHLARDWSIFECIRHNENGILSREKWSLFERIFAIRHIRRFPNCSRRKWPPFVAQKQTSDP